MISDNRLEEALRWLALNVEPSAEARAHKWVMVEGRKVKKAQLMSQSNEQTETAKERYAYSHADYQAYLEEAERAIYEDAKLEFKRDVESKVIESWRTQQANIRAAERVT